VKGHPERNPPHRLTRLGRQVKLISPVARVAVYLTSYQLGSLARCLRFPKVTIALIVKSKPSDIAVACIYRRPWGEWF